MHARGARLLREARDAASTSLPCCIIRSANSSTTMHDASAASRDVAARVGRSSLGIEQHLLAVGAVRAHLARAPWPNGVHRHLAARARASTQRVVGADVLRAGVGEQLVAPLHLVDRPPQRVRRLLHVGDDRQQHVRDAVERRELDDLRDRSSSRRSSSGVRFDEQRREHDVEADALAGAGRAGDDHVRHLARGRRRRAARRCPCRTRPAAAVELLEALVLDELAQVARSGAARSAARSRCGPCRGSARRCAPSARERQREVVGEAGDLARPWCRSAARTRTS